MTLRCRTGSNLPESIRNRADLRGRFRNVAECWLMEQGRVDFDAVEDVGDFGERSVLTHQLSYFQSNPNVRPSSPGFGRHKSVRFP